MKQKKKAEVDNPGKLLMRILGYVGKTYKVHLILVVIGIFVSVLANVQGTMFMKTMIDDYIVPLLQADVPDFRPFAMAIYGLPVFMQLELPVLMHTTKL